MQSKTMKPPVIEGMASGNDEKGISTLWEIESNELSTSRGPAGGGGGEGRREGEEPPNT